MHHRRDQAQDRPRLRQVGVEDLQEDRPGVIGLAGGVVEGDAGGRGALFGQAAQPLRQLLQRGAYDGRQVEAGGEGGGGLRSAAVQRVGGGGVAGVRPLPETLRRIQAEGVEVGGREAFGGAAVDRQHDRLDHFGRLFGDPAPEPGHRLAWEPQSAGRVPRRAERDDGGQDHVAGGPVGGLGRHHPLYGPHGFVAVSAGGEGGFEVVDRPVRSGLDQQANCAELTFRKVCHGRPVDS